MRKKFGDGEWVESSYYPVYGFELTPPDNYIETYTWGEGYENRVISYRVRMMIYDTSTVLAATPWSNVATVGVKASSWATPEIEKAMAYGLVPDSTKGDFTKPITFE